MTGSDVPGGRAADAEARIRAALAQIERIGSEVAARQQREGDQRAEAARRGDLGPDWRAVQRRVDAGETTLDAVFGGTDESREAVALRAGSRARLEALAGQPVDQVPESVADALGALEQLRSRFGRQTGGRA
ncbi:hypothetical protein [Cellulomonas telluris]|uniref:hypothetical protein n=1 Tax=Cellulomonas telluris TaxID=2306636 RepID=UPI0010A7D82B|nr:hypothetical protein [Cellulomonas telluris]